MFIIKTNKKKKKSELNSEINAKKVEKKEMQK